MIVIKSIYISTTIVSVINRGLGPPPKNRNSDANTKKNDSDIEELRHA